MHNIYRHIKLALFLNRINIFLNTLSVLEYKKGNIQILEGLELLIAPCK